MNLDNLRDGDLWHLAHALRDTHVAEASFQYLEFESCYNMTGDLENEIRALLGTDRVVRNHSLSES
ncbi:hypothetical protein PENSPDRAFT_651338 [Peniophora sp. CONT]|nr:hypothetical protein PENSPDRAFT_651338 [Peniophora sp. CONT]